MQSAPHYAQSGYLSNEARNILRMRHLVPLIILALALLGMADSVYMTLAHYNVVSLASLEPSGACSLTGKTCSLVVTSPQASVFGIPHALLGAAYFTALIGAALIRLKVGCWFAPWEMLGFLIAGFGWSVYLTQELLLQLHIPCPYCLTAHGINTAIVALYIASFRNWCS